MIVRHLTERQFNEILHITNVYRLQALRCRKSKAYLVGCIMIGSALEGALIAAADVSLDEVRKAGKIPRRKSRPKPLLEWTLFELLGVARDLGWLPSALSLGDRWNQQKAEIGDYAMVVREVRNLVHPARYLADYPRAGVRKKEFDFFFDVLTGAVDWLIAKVTLDLKKQLEKVDRGRAGQRHQTVAMGS